MMAFTENEINNYYEEVKEQLLSNEKYKFDKINNWCNSLNTASGVYAIFIDADLKYIGETGNFKARMREVHRTYNHSFRKKLGYQLNGTIIKNTFDHAVEEELNVIFNNNVSVAFVPIPFGRLEIETKLVTEFQHLLLNSVKKRK
ncbi:MAG: hypothetical protein K2Y30_01250 [Flavobacteriaceae bacterium]|nr:hypothetical protein [Flavobacteriaceae bacterium]